MAVLDSLVPIKTFVERYPDLGSVEMLQRWIRLDHAGFRSHCVVRWGQHTYLLDVQRVEEWFERRRLRSARVRSDTASTRSASDGRRSDVTRLRTAPHGLPDCATPTGSAAGGLPDATPRTRTAPEALPDAAASTGRAPDTRRRGGKT